MAVEDHIVLDNPTNNFATLNPLVDNLLDKSKSDNGFILSSDSIISFKIIEIE